MINNQNLAVLSEKVAHLESAVSASTSASGISYDNTGSGLTADNAQAAIDEVDAKFSNKGLCYRDMTLSFDENGSYRFDNDNALLAVVGNADKIIRAEVLNGSGGYVIAISTYLAYKYFLLRNSRDFSSVASTEVSARIYWIDNIINKNI